MSHFVKVYGSILYSSIWAEDHPTRILWITMLAMADSTGYVEAATPGLARVANISGEECKRALEILQAPDLESKSQDWAGARVEKVEGGWQLLNYQRYREQRTESQVKRAERQARYRAKVKASTVDDVDGQRGEGRGETRDVLVVRDVNLERSLSIPANSRRSLLRRRRRARRWWSGTTTGWRRWSRP